MQTLDVLTSQNVTIEYPLAGITDRIFAFVIDLLLTFALIIGLFLVFSIILSIVNISISFYFIAIPIFAFYTLFSEIFSDGQTWGKKIIGLKVVKVNGEELRVSDCIARWTFRLVDIYFSIGIVGMFMISSTVRSQRLGDIIANTAVIKIKPFNVIRLKHIEKIRSLEDYTPTYPQVLRMTEPEMLIIKSALEETKKFPNKSHIRVLSELVRIVCDRLLIEIPEEQDDVFLQTIINDFIVLTR